MEEPKTQLTPLQEWKCHERPELRGTKPQTSEREAKALISNCFMRKT